MKINLMFFIFLLKAVTLNTYAAEKSMEGEGGVKQEEVCEAKCSSSSSKSSNSSFVFTTPPPSPREGEITTLPVSPESRRRDQETSLYHFSSEELEGYRAEVSEGTLSNLINGELRYQVIYFFHSNGNLYIMPNYFAEDYDYQHSSFDIDLGSDNEETSGNCMMAGEMYISSEKILINDDSGHYKPSIALQETNDRLNLVVRKLRELGIKKNIQITHDAW